MQKAIEVGTNKIIYPNKSKSAVCQCCGESVIAKCGSIRIHHWAHKKKDNCDSWYEPMTDWHIEWQNNFPEEWREIVLISQETGEKHIADIYTPNMYTIEIQNSPISIEEYKSRRDFYKKLIWVINGEKFGFTRLIRDYKAPEIKLEIINNESDFCFLLKKYRYNVIQHYNQLIITGQPGQTLVELYEEIKNTLSPSHYDWPFFSKKSFIVSPSNYDHSWINVIPREEGGVQYFIQYKRNRAIYNFFKKDNVLIDNIPGEKGILFFWKRNKVVLYDDFIAGILKSNQFEPAQQI